MNALYSFTATKKALVEKTTDTAEGTLTSKVEEDVAIRIDLKKPSRQENEEAEELYAVEVARAIKAGLLTEPLVVKYYADQGGIFTEEEQKEYSALMLGYVERQNEYQRASLLPEAPDKAAKVEEATKAIIDVQSRLQDFKRAQQSLFNQTVEKRAGDKTITWYVLTLTYITEGEGEPQRLFKGKTFEDRLKELDALEESGNVEMLKVFQKALLFLTFWYMGNAQKPEDFKYLEDAIAEPKAPSEPVAE